MGGMTIEDQIKAIQERNQPTGPQVGPLCALLLASSLLFFPRCLPSLLGLAPCPLSLPLRLPRLPHRAPSLPRAHSPLSPLPLPALRSLVRLVLPLPQRALLARLLRRA